MAPIRFSPIPVFIISFIGTLPLLKMIALGAVATGIIKAKLALMVAGSINIIGLTLIASAVESKIGINTAVVAVLLVISVRKETEIHIIPTINQIG